MPEGRNYLSLCSDLFDNAPGGIKVVLLLFPHYNCVACV